MVEEIAAPVKKEYDGMYPRIIDLATPAVVEAPAPEPVEELTPLTFKVPQPSPSVTVPPVPVTTVTQTPTPASHRSEITLNDLTAPSEITLSSLKPPKSSLDGVPDNGDVTFTYQDGQPANSRTVYQGQRR
jgi:hypothetical protein